MCTLLLQPFVFLFFLLTCPTYLTSSFTPPPASFVVLPSAPPSFLTHATITANLEKPANSDLLKLHQKDLPLKTKFEQILLYHQTKITDYLSEIEGLPDRSPQPSFPTILSSGCADSDPNTPTPDENPNLPIGPFKPRSTSSPIPWIKDNYIRPDGLGGGITMVLNGRRGGVFDKAGIAISVLYGRMPVKSSIAATGSTANTNTNTDSEDKGIPFYACGISSVIHPSNPHNPTIHFNYRYFQTTAKSWFGGGTDITPCYVNEGDMFEFHSSLKDVVTRWNNCSSSEDEKMYYDMKEHADEYFRIPHRFNETRGLGGIFYDNRIPDANKTTEDYIDLASNLLSTIPTTYGSILEQNYLKPYSTTEKKWQNLRRGRYVEFNLLYDRGTTFGLSMRNARVESILMSLPSVARWGYCGDEGWGEEGEEMKFLREVRGVRDWSVKE